MGAKREGADGEGRTEGSPTLKSSCLFLVLRLLAFVPLGRIV